VSWQAYPTWAVGQVSTASDWNQYIASNVNFLATPPVCRATRNAAWSLTAATAIVPYDAAFYDTASGFNASSHLYSAPVVGYYQVWGGYQGTTSSTNQAYNAQVWHNLAVASVGNQTEVPSTSEGFAVYTLDVVQCAIGDTLGIYYFSQGTGAGATGGNTYMGVLKVSN
jgi:hypothetical protein